MIKTCRKGLHQYDKSKYRRCPECKKITDKRWFTKMRKESPEKEREYKRIWARNHRDVLENWVENNRDKSNAIKKKWRDNNPDATSAATKIWRGNNPGQAAAHVATRRSKKLKATPSWLTKEQKKEIAEFYKLAKELQWLSEDPLEVDHIIPLQGENVSGLHVPWNLQILPRDLNLKKGNRI
jgi:hypothetical protein